MSLCQYCEKLNNWEWNTNLSVEYKASEVAWIEHHPSYDSLYKSVTEGCRLCSLLRSGLLHWMEDYATQGYLGCEWEPGTAEEYLTETIRDPGERLFLVLMQQIDDYIYTDTMLFHGFDYRWWRPDDICNIWKEDCLFGATFHFKALTDSFPKVFLHRSQGLRANLDLALDWLNRCMSDHSECVQQRQAGRPTRLLQINDSNEGKEEPQVHLIETGNTSEPYVAFSHCWGTIQPVCTTKENYEIHTNGIQFTSLPRSFQDAVTVTRTLGANLLWIDSLCIVQNSYEDWERECPRMASIYANALVTIAAADAPDSSAGFLNDYPAAKFGVYQLRHPNNPRSCVVVGYALPGQENIMFHQKYRLLRRGWALQERLLSHRFLSFRFDRMQWECSTCCYSDDLECPFTIDFDSTSQAKKRSMRGLKDARDIFSYWREIIETYSDCKLSKGTDKLPALSGLAHAFSTILHDTYIAGIWRNDIHNGLSWMRYNSNKKLNSPHIEESPLTYRAPSWSWASTDSCVSFHRYFHCQPYDDLVIISVDNQTQGLDAFGQVMCSTLHVSGRLRKGIVQGWNGRGTGFNVGSTHEQISSVGTLYLDSVQSIKRLQGIEKGQKYVMALLISYSTDDRGAWVALALEQISGKGKDLIFQRVGFIQNEKSDVEGYNWFENSERKAVWIV